MGMATVPCLTRNFTRRELVRLRVLDSAVHTEFERHAHDGAADVFWSVFADQDGVMWGVHWQQGYDAAGNRVDTWFGQALVRADRVEQRHCTVMKWVRADGSQL